MARRLWRVLVTLVLMLFVTALACAGMLFQTLRAAPGEWAHAVAIGPWRVALSVPAIVRMATHPLGLRVLAGRTLRHTPLGTLRLQAGPNEGALRVVCEPCVIRHPAVGPRALPLARTELTLQRVGQNRLHGELASGPLRATWQAELRRADITLQVQLPDTPMRDVYAPFAAAIPEWNHVQIEGRAGGEFSLALPAMQWHVVPRIEGFRVSGLGTQVLLHAAPTPACAQPTRPADAAAPFGPWLPQAVVAAEDQRFNEHTGFDLVEMKAAWAQGTPRGASTLSQQLAKLLYTGDERSAARKLRELLYAVELDRTLGKARVLQLYLAIAPWGEHRCGAQAAALHLLHKRASAVTPVEAAWLASLLRNPDALLQREAGADAERLTAILSDMRPAPHRLRRMWVGQVKTWGPPRP